MFGKYVVAAATLAVSVFAQSGVIYSPPALIQCQPAQISWTVNTKAPYYVSVIPGGQATAPALVDLGSHDASPLTWIVNRPVGESVSLKLIDGNGAPYYSSAVTVQAGSSTACLNSTASVAGTSSTGAVAAGGAASSAATSGSAMMSSAATSASAMMSSSGSSAAGVVSSAKSSAAGASAPATSASAASKSAGGSSAAPAASAAASSGAASRIEITGFGALLLGAIGAAAAL